MRDTRGYLRGVPGAIVLFVVALALAGCASAAPAAVSSPTTSADPTPTITNQPQAADQPVVLKPNGTALQNIGYFAAVGHELLDSAPDSPGRAIIDHLVAAGFDKAGMELTPDTTAVGLDADNVQFSVRMNGSCLIGQAGNVGFHSLAAPMLATGTCLVGKTRAIDW